jgi:CHAD domain-containing protein
MSYELEHGQNLGDNVRRICRKQIQGAIDFAQGKKETHDTPVHETRKSLKKARAGLRLVRKEIGRGLHRQQDHLLRDVGRLISEVRDAEVRLSTVRQLQQITQRRGRAIYRDLESTLFLELENFTAAFADWHVQAVPMLERAAAAIDCWQLDRFDLDQLRGAVQSSYKTARRNLHRAQTSHSAENFHNFRSAAKVLLHQLRILRPINPVVLTNLSDELRALGGLLGRARDLNFLGERLRVQGGETKRQRDGQNLLAIIEVSQGDLQRGAADLGERFFSERPRDFGDRVATWLRDWTNSSSRSVAEALLS